MEQGEQDEGGLRWRILDRLEGVRKERTRISSQIKTIGKKLKELKAEPEALQDSERLAELERERAGFRELMRSLNDKHILNFFTDEGLLPNYAFPEAGGDIAIDSLAAAIAGRVRRWQEIRNLHTSGGDKRPRTFTGKCFRALDPPQKFRLIDKIISRVKKYPVVIKKKGLANTTRPKSIICYPHSIIPYSKNI
jgi:hypothetical protein